MVDQKTQTNHGTAINKLYSSDCLPGMINRVTLKTAASVSPFKTIGEHALLLAPIPSEQQYDKIAGLFEMKNAYEIIEQKI